MAKKIKKATKFHKRAKKPQKKPSHLRKRTKRQRASGHKSSKRLPSFRGLKLKEAAAIISSHLSASGHEPVLVGQAAAAIYSAGAINPKTLEFVIQDFAFSAVDCAMERIGFTGRNEHTFVSSRCPYEIVLLPSPVAVGDCIVEDLRNIATPKGTIRCLTPTDCVRHRLSMFYRWGDDQAMTEAVRVCRRNQVNMELIRRWSEWEWCGEQFQKFLGELESKRKARKKR